MQNHALRELDAHFIRRHQRGWTRVKALAKADGIELMCPVCFEKIGGNHRLRLWFRWRGNPDGPQWAVSKQSTSLDDLTFVHGRPVQAKSVGIGKDNEHAHFFIEGGMVVNTSQDLHEPEMPK
jgi:hypothetical protein